MTPIVEIGEAVVALAEENGGEFFFRPSFAAMMSLGEPAEIVNLFVEIHSSGHAEKFTQLSEVSPVLYGIASRLQQREEEKMLTAAMRVLEACCDTDPAVLIGEWQGDDEGIRYLPGWLSQNDIIVMARHFMTHGIIGKAKIRQLQRHETNETTSAFNAIEYINAARIHLEMTRAEAEQLTMTEFQMLLAQKYPDQKGFTREEYDNIADDFLAKQAARRAAAEATA